MNRLRVRVKGPKGYSINYSVNVRGDRSEPLRRGRRGRGILREEIVGVVEGKLSK